MVPGARRGGTRAGFRLTPLSGTGCCLTEPGEQGGEDAAQSGFDLDDGVAEPRVARTVHRAEVPSHLPLGVNAASMALDHSRHQTAEATAWEKVSRSAGFGEPYPVELP